MEKDFHLTLATHGALTQYYRWYQVYEVPFTQKTIANQKDILDDEVEIVAVQGTTKGKTNLEERLKVYEGWQNAHHVQQTSVKLTGEGKIALEADIVYQNIRPDQSRYSYTIHYSTVLRQRENDLPVFEKIELKPTGAIESFVFESAYAENRCRSFMHYWLYLVESFGSLMQFKELLAPGFQLDLATGGLVDSPEKMEAWLQSTRERVLKSAHTPKNFSVTNHGNNTFDVSVIFDWQGINVLNQNMVAETQHEWLLENNPDERFARMKKMKVSLIRPFQVV